MNKELENKLFEKYPKIFVQKDLSMIETCMCWGICCGDGWYWLIDQLCSALQYHTDENGFPQVEALQVKEKFGGLRFYASGIADELRGYISFAERLSDSICELCGSTEHVIQTGGWIMTRCAKCLERQR